VFHSGDMAFVCSAYETSVDLRSNLLLPVSTIPIGSSSLYPKFSLMRPVVSIPKGSFHVPRFAFSHGSVFPFRSHHLTSALIRVGTYCLCLGL
jgi:hypothetical protein